MSRGNTGRTRVLFAGTPDIAVPTLRALNGAEWVELIGVLCAEDSVVGRGRGRKPAQAPAVKRAALDMGVRVLQPHRLDAAFRSEIAVLEPDMLVVFAYGRIFGPRFLGLFDQGALNVHPSALPKFRGPSPLSAAILAGHDQTAVSVQKVALEMDSGDIVRSVPVPLDGTETAGSLGRTVAELAPAVLLAALDDLRSGRAVAVPQDNDAATYCPVVTTAHSRIDWSQPAVNIERAVRAYLPWPVCRTTVRGFDVFVHGAVVHGDVAHGSSPMVQSSGNCPAGTVVGVDKSDGLLVQTGQGVLGLCQLQRAGRKVLPARDFLNGVRLDTGELLGKEADG